MPIPDYETLMLPALKLFSGGAKNVSECLPSIKHQFGVTDEEAEELLPAGRVTTLQSRTHWARTYLSKAGLLESPRRNLHVITALGREVLNKNPSAINNAFLDQFGAFSSWRTASDATDATRGEQLQSAQFSESQTPEDAMETANRLLESALRDDLLSLLLELSPQRFERVILDLLAAMGFGSGSLSNGHMTKTSGDGGIDGIIHEDALGLDAVYVQAKRYALDNRISRPDIQRFVGSLTGEGATKGVFVTTSDFSKEAQEYVSRVQHRIVLINGKRFAELMLKHGVGVRVRATYSIQTVDEDYFA
jgi:restriction system protein